MEPCIVLLENVKYLIAFILAAPLSSPAGRAHWPSPDSVSSHLKYKYIWTLQFMDVDLRLMNGDKAFFLLQLRKWFIHLV